jgi:hypothetical protein
MISYCIVAYRPTYARLLLADLVEKTSVPFEILVWLNAADAALDADIETTMARGVPVRVVGRTPDNIGMRAYASLFRAARYPLITQIDDDVICISRGIAQRADRLFRRFPAVRQLVADVWQDEHTTGARPPLDHYRAFDGSEGLYSGPIDGWFAVYHRSILPLLLGLPFAEYFPCGGLVCAQLAQRGQHGLLDLGMKVFHVIGPAYADAFGISISRSRSTVGSDGSTSSHGTKATATLRPLAKRSVLELKQSGLHWTGIAPRSSGLCNQRGGRTIGSAGIVRLRWLGRNHSNPDRPTVTYKSAENNFVDTVTSSHGSASVAQT